MNLTGYKVVKRAQRPEKAGKATEEAKEWGKYRFPILIKESSAVTHLSFNPVAPHDVAVSVGPRVRVFDGSSASEDPLQTYQKFKGVAYGGSWRKDGKLLVAGGEEGRIRVFNADNRSMLKYFRGHVGAVRVCKFHQDNTSIMSGGDDGSVRKWDLPTGQQVFSELIHTDYIRDGCSLEGNSCVFLSGGYDKVVSAVDSRVGKEVWRLELQHPVEAIHTVGGLLCCANGPGVSIYDMSARGRGEMVRLSNHTKTVTSISTCRGSSRLVSGSVDQTVKVWDMSSFTALHTMKFSSAILCLGVSPDDNQWVVGMADGLISIQHKPVAPPTEEVREKRREIRKMRLANAGVTGHWQRGRAHVPAADDYRVPAGRKEKPQKHDIHLKRYEYKQALDAALESARVQPGICVNVLADLIDRHGLDIALSGRSDSTLLPLFKFIHNNIAKTHYSSILLDVADRLVELYSPVLRQSHALSNEIRKLRDRINTEITLQQKYLELSGVLETVAGAIE